MVLRLPDSAEPVAVLKAIRDQCPNGGSEKLLSIFVACVHDNPPLQKTIVTRAFVAALAEVTAAPQRKP